jgi:CheY-like chemotaxis protein
MARRLRLAIHHMSAAETRRALILVVDDDPFVLRLIADALAAEGTRSIPPEMAVRRWIGSPPARTN